MADTNVCSRYRGSPTFNGITARDDDDDTPMYIRILVCKFCCGSHTFSLFFLPWLEWTPLTSRLIAQTSRSGQLRIEFQVRDM